ncbi:hypothetical protein SAMN05660742_1213 [Propionispira arboris]|uniref:Polymerase/histidinol phosphatase N-terminal domain-containing protein n=1 Tax=Propionispira arboris TaxID=84035 RepID=A0A1H7CKQ5_9FIRM|nr:PHP domain-containing protein [Propionispira arboris]SEJ87260.1 hypothetical protein SAMN05660742_1213 [Propionispira arboris]
MKFVDLHVHSNISDGSYTPVELIKLAHKTGLSAITLSDHETIAGNAEAKVEADKLGIEFISGMEITVDYKNRHLHLVALGFDVKQPAFQNLYKKIRDLKEAKMEELIWGIKEKGVPISMELIQPFTLLNKIDRYAIMRYLVSLHLFDHVQPIWDQYLNPVIRQLKLNHNVSVEETTQAIKAAGGMTSLAHFHKRLGLAGLNRQEQEAAIAELCAMGLDGMEQYYPNYTAADQAFAESMLTKYKMIPTGGSDFHGLNRPEVALGTGIKNNIVVPYTLYENVLQYCQRTV